MRNFGEQCAVDAEIETMIMEPSEIFAPFFARRQWDSVVEHFIVKCYHFQIVVVTISTTQTFELDLTLSS